MEKIIGYCLDTDILIDYLRGLESARDFLLSASERGILYISVVAITEVYSGKETREPQKKAAIDNFLRSFQIIEFSPAIAEFAGTIRRDYGAPFADAIVAAGSITYSVSLVTRNIKHYQKIKNLSLVGPY